MYFWANNCRNEDNDVVRKSLSASVSSAQTATGEKKHTVDVKKQNQLGRENEQNFFLFLYLRLSMLEGCIFLGWGI